VQGALEAALARVLRLPVEPRTTVAGRTDAGVHATGQVAHVDIPTEALEAAGGCQLLARRLNGVLAPDVRVQGLDLAHAGFDARFSALSRSYAYRVSDGVPDPIRRRDTLSVRRHLDEELMERAAQQLVGEHDFVAYCRQREGASTVRELQAFHWGRDAAGVLVASVLADGFCHSMVRALVAALIAVGEGRRPEGWPAEILVARLRDPGVGVAPAHGLTLVAVSYPEPRELAARADQTRRHRPPVAGRQ